MPPKQIERVDFLEMSGAQDTHMFEQLFPTSLYTHWKKKQQQNPCLGETCSNLEQGKTN